MEIVKYKDLSLFILRVMSLTKKKPVYRAREHYIVTFCRKYLDRIESIYFIVCIPIIYFIYYYLFIYYITICYYKIV